MFVSRSVLYYTMVNLLCELGVYSLHSIIVNKDRSSSTLLFIFSDGSLQARDCWYDDAGLRLARELNSESIHTLSTLLCTLAFEL